MITSAAPSILNLITTLEPDGAQVVLLDTIRRLDPERFRIVLGFLIGRGSALRGSPPAGVEIVDLSRRGRFDPLCFARVARLIRDERIGIVHTHLVHAGIIGKTAARMLRVPTVTTRHYVRDPKEATLPYRLENRLTSGSAVVIAVSRAVESHARQTRLCAPEKLVMIPNGVDVATFDPGRFAPPARGASLHDLVIGCAGRLQPEKGHSVLISAFERVARGCDRARLQIVGVGPLRGTLEARARELGLAEKVRFLGAVPHEAMAETIAGWDLFAMPSLGEGFGLAAAEAMAMERAVVASRIDGLAEVVGDEESGALVPPNDPMALAEAITNLIGDPERRLRMGRAGRERIMRRYSVEQTAAGVTRVYDRILLANDPSRKGMKR